MPDASPSPEIDRVARLEQELSRVSEALKRTERSLGGFQWALSLLVIAGVAAVILVRNGLIDLNQVFNRQSVASTLESKEFGLYNRNGKRVLIADEDKFGYPSLAFLDLDLNYKMGIKMYSDAPGGAPGIAFYDKTGTRALFRIGTEGEALIQLLGQDKRGGLVLKTAKDGSPSLTMTDSSGKVLFRAPEGTPLSTESSSPAEPRR